MTQEKRLTSAKQSLTLISVAHSARRNLEQTTMLDLAKTIAIQVIMFAVVFAISTFLALAVTTIWPNVLTLTCVG